MLPTKQIQPSNIQNINKRLCVIEECGALIGSKKLVEKTGTPIENEGDRSTW